MVADMAKAGETVLGLEGEQLKASLVRGKYFKAHEGKSESDTVGSLVKMVCNRY